MGIGQQYVDRYVRKTGNKLFLHFKKLKHIKPSLNNELEPEKKITRLAIGVEGGFQVEDPTNKYQYEEKNSIAIFPGPVKFSLPIPNLPKEVNMNLGNAIAIKLTIPYFFAA